MTSPIAIFDVLLLISIVIGTWWFYRYMGSVWYLAPLAVILGVIFGPIFLIGGGFILLCLIILIFLS